MTTQTYWIRIKDLTLRVRRTGDVREVELEGKWRNAHELIEWLVAIGRHDIIEELAEHGMRDSFRVMGED